MVEKVFCDVCGKEVFYKEGYYIIEIKAHSPLQVSRNIAIISRPTKKEICIKCLEDFLSKKKKS